MPKPDEFISLFHLDPVLPRSACTAATVALAHDPSFGEGIAAVFELFDTRAKGPSGKSLFVALSRVQALILAKLIHDLAKAQGWPDLPETTHSRTYVPPKDQTS